MINHDITMKKTTFSALTLLTVLGLSGCGQTGPLYIEDEQPEPVNTGEVSIKGEDGSVTVKPVETTEPTIVEDKQPADAQQGE